MTSTLRRLFRRNLVTESLSAKRVFVGSSTEGKPFAEAVIELIKEGGLSPLAWFDFFRDSRPPLQELEHLTLRADAAILIATEDDRAIIRGKNWRQMRDNVLFEYGLFAGTIGRAKCGLILPDSNDFRIPSDFLGVACFKTFDGRDIQSAAQETVQSLVGLLRKPPRPETTETRGRRLLHLIGWIRDESLRIVQGWDHDGGKAIISGRIVAVSGFLHDDIDQLKLRKEYDEVEKILFRGIENFPGIGRSSFKRRDMEHAIEEMVRGRVPAHPEMLGGFRYIYDRADIPVRCDCDCGCCRAWLRRRDRPSYWYDDEYHPWNRRPSYWHGCGPFAYAVGAAEAATVFKEMADSTISELKAWLGWFVPPLNDAVARFERQLHEQMFGSL